MLPPRWWPLIDQSSHACFASHTHAGSCHTRPEQFAGISVAVVTNMCDTFPSVPGACPTAFARDDPGPTPPGPRTCATF